MLSRRARFLILGLAIALSACSSEPGRPTTPTAPGATTIDIPGASRIAGDYVQEVVAVMQANSINRLRIDWDNFKSQVFSRAENAQVIADTIPAISVALGLLDDHHSFYVTSANVTYGNPNGRRCSAVIPATPVVPAAVGYVKVSGAANAGPAGDTAFADSIQDQIRARDTPGLVGWIVDLRGNTGGNMWPMVAGVGPVLGAGTAGYFVPPLGNTLPWSYDHGQSLSAGTPVTRTTAIYELIAASPRVAVLMDNRTASSGEAVVVSFENRPGTRLFGTLTCGLSTANGTYRLSDGAMLYVTNAVMADRSLVRYGDQIAPDETIAGDSEVVARAIEWLRSGR